MGPTGYPDILPVSVTTRPLRYLTVSVLDTLLCPPSTRLTLFISVSW